MVCPLQDSANAGVLLDYCTRRLDRQTAEELNRHIAACAECREFAESQSQIWSALDAWDAEPVSAVFDDQLYLRVEDEERRGFWSRILGDVPNWKPALPIGVAVAALAITIVLNQPAKTVPQSVPAGQSEALDPEQIERSAEDLEMLRQFSTPAQSSQSI